MGTTFGDGPELLVELRRDARRPLRAQLEDGLREATRNGRLAAGTRLPATRSLAADLGVSRRLVVDAYAQLRRALADHLGRVRGVVADPQRIVICSGTAQGLVLLARALDGPHLAVEDPGLPPHRAILAAHGARLSALPVDADGACVHELARISARAGAPDGVLVTPAHQSPSGVALAPQRRASLLEWASGGARVVIEDDYDAEYRYDRSPLAALQGLAPERVIYMGTASKTLAPALRLGWLVLPARLVERVVEQ